MIPIGGATQLYRKAELPAVLLQAALDHALHRDAMADVADVRGLAFELKRAGARDDAERLVVGQRVRQILGDAVGEIFLGGIAGQVHERQDDDRMHRLGGKPELPNSDSGGRDENSREGPNASTRGGERRGGRSWLAPYLRRRCFDRFGDAAGDRRNVTPLGKLEPPFVGGPSRRVVVRQGAAQAAHLGAYRRLRARIEGLGLPVNVEPDPVLAHAFFAPAQDAVDQVSKKLASTLGADSGVGKRAIQGAADVLRVLPNVGLDRWFHRRRSLGFDCIRLILLGCNVAVPLPYCAPGVRALQSQS